MAVKEIHCNIVFHKKNCYYYRTNVKGLMDEL
ncbi:hypothetical protein MEZE111188_11605 [Mesobacillus zeae]